jgi:transcriptional regulator of acetoin/glycerol metabolism
MSTLPETVQGQEPVVGGDCTLEQLERAHAEAVIYKCRLNGWSLVKASEILGIDNTTLYRKRKRWGIV